MEKLRYSFLLIIPLLFFTACVPAKSVDENFFAMGTVITQKVHGANAQRAADEVTAKVRELEALMTVNAPGGDVNKLNDHAGKAPIDLKPDTITVLKMARRLSEMSQGAFDVTIGPVVKAWNIGTVHSRIPPAETLKDLVPLVNYADLYIDEANNRASLKRTGQIVDLGGIAKGYAGDVAKEIYKKNNIQSAFINLGGNVVALGNKPDGSPWLVGVRHPRSQTGEVIGAVQISDQAVVTSGDYERYFEQDGIRYSHILDPRTGYPVQSDLMSVTIVAASSTEADGLSTAVFVLGLDKGLELINRYVQVEAILITTDKKIYVTKGLQDKFLLQDDRQDYKVIRL